MDTTTISVEELNKTIAGLILVTTPHEERDQLMLDVQEKFWYAVSRERDRRGESMTGQWIIEFNALCISFSAFCKIFIVRKRSISIEGVRKMLRSFIEICEYDYKEDNADNLVNLK